MSSMPTLTPLLPGLWQPVQRAPMTFAYTFVKVGFSVSHTTSTVWVAAAHPGALGDTVSVIVTVPGVAGQVKLGDALAALSNVPAVAIHATVSVSDTIPVVPATTENVCEPAHENAPSAVVAVSEIV